MPRIGMNPARGRETAYKPARVTLAVLTYLPEETGYFQHRFDVTRLCIESLIANTSQPYDLLVFDNGSAPQLVDYLREMNSAGKINYLMLSERNIGKIGALQMIFKAAPGELIAYTDDDVFFLPGWLEEHLKILETYPDVGLVTGFYIRAHVAYAMQSLEKFMAGNEVEIERGLLLEEQWIRHFNENMGRSRAQYDEETAGLEDIALKYRDIATFASAGHHQFLAPKQVLVDALPTAWQGKLMGKMRELEEDIDKLGFMRLSTREPVTRLLGNVISPEMAEEARKYGFDISGVEQKRKSALRQRIYDMKLTQKIAWRLYNLSYDAITSKKS
ncbi:MAG: hypothetical protein DRI32_05935 [Chloroflexi bacterium]|nr:MAG: hypothetical protein DRI32_05935 [Chloroflexota bacterium]